MPKMLGLQCSDVESYLYSRVPCPQIFHRTFVCGHPDEFIEVRSVNGEKVHNLISSDVFVEYSRAGNRPTYIEARCLNCAKKAKDNDDNDSSVQPKRTLSAYRSGTSSTYSRIIRKDLQDAFEGTMGRDRWSSGQVKIAELHARVSEEDHQAYRHEILKEAVRSSGKWLALPVRRVTNMTVQTTSEFDIGARIKDTTHPLDNEDTAVSQATIDAKKICASVDGLHYHQTGSMSSRFLFGSETKEAVHTKDAIFLEATPDIVDKVDGRSSRNISRGKDENFPLDAERTYSLPGPDISQQCQPSNGGDSIEDTGEVISPSGIAERSALLRRQSAFAEKVIEQPFDDSVVLSAGQTKYETPRSAPCVPRRSTLGSKERRSNATTRASMHPEFGSKHVRKLSLELFQSARSSGKRESDSQSPDWACRTSLAIEAGRISMDNGGKQSQKSVSSKYSSEAGPNSSELTSVGRSRKEAAESRVRHESQPTISDECSPVPSTLDICSGGALQAVQRASTTRSARKPKGSVMIRNRGQSKRHRAQVISSIDLNKSLPALPLSGDEKVNRM
ncbi:hypothetical protein SVAN01_00218 [Stagonosporopsis vannaccii]|nr:hypothetical protein SVAN01_00218 [Stagonosporopsis vannaccii]